MCSYWVLVVLYLLDVFLLGLVVSTVCVPIGFSCTVPTGCVPIGFSCTVSTGCVPIGFSSTVPTGCVPIGFSCSILYCTYMYCSTHDCFATTSPL